MILVIQSHLDYRLDSASSIILQIEAAAMEGQRVLEQDLQMSPVGQLGRVAADEGVGERLMIQVANGIQVTYTAKVEVTRDIADIASLSATPVHLLPGEAVRYLMGSRYCPSDRFQSYVMAEFGQSMGGARVADLRDWIGQHIAYTPGSSDSGTTALETFVQRNGICRDFAHVLITLARASGIPARFASVYAPGVTPPDFHAVADVYLGGEWHLVDATGMATEDKMARICVGRDAADCAFMTIYGRATMNAQQVTVTEAG